MYVLFYLSDMYVYLTKWDLEVELFLFKNLQFIMNMYAEWNIEIIIEPGTQERMFTGNSIELFCFFHVNYYLVR